MSDIQTPNGLEANETLVGATDEIEVYQPASEGIRRNKKAFLDTLKTFFQTITGGVLNNIVTFGGSNLMHDSGVAVADIGTNTTHRSSDGDDHFNVLNSYKGINHIVLTNYTGTGVPAIAADSQCEINGNIYTNPSEVAISGSTSDSTWYDILLTPSGTTFTASFVARNTGVWSDSKQGLYSGNNRVIACVYRNTSTNYINKNILIVNNRTCKIKIEIGSWDMDADASLIMSHGLGSNYVNIRGIIAMIHEDNGAHVTPLTYDTGSQSGNISFSQPDNALALTRATGEFFDDLAYNDTGINRGWVTIDYEV